MLLRQELCFPPGFCTISEDLVQFVSRYDYQRKFAVGDKLLVICSSDRFEGDFSWITCATHKALHPEWDMSDMRCSGECCAQRQVSMGLEGRCEPRAGAPHQSCEQGEASDPQREMCVMVEQRFLLWSTSLGLQPPVWGSSSPGDIPSLAKVDVEDSGKEHSHCSPVAKSCTLQPSGTVPHPSPGFSSSPGSLVLLCVTECYQPAVRLGSPGTPVPLAGWGGDLCRTCPHAVPHSQYRCPSSRALSAPWQSLHRPRPLPTTPQHIPHQHPGPRVSAEKCHRPIWDPSLQFSPDQLFYGKNEEVRLSCLDGSPPSLPVIRCARQYQDKQDVWAVRDGESSWRQVEKNVTCAGG